LPEPTYTPTPERERLIAALDDLQHRAVEIALGSDDKTVQHRFRNVAQGVASQKSLLILDWEMADGARPDSAE
jgi:hypothetical protein